MRTKFANNMLLPQVLLWWEHPQLCPLMDLYKSFLAVYAPRSGTAGPSGKHMLHFIKCCQITPKWLYQDLTPNSNAWGFMLPPILANTLCYPTFIFFACLMDVKKCLVLVHNYLIISEWGCISLHLLVSVSRFPSANVPVHILWLFLLCFLFFLSCFVFSMMCRNS